MKNETNLRINNQVIQNEFNEYDKKRANVIISTFVEKVEEVAPVRFAASRDEKNSALKMRELFHKTLGVPSKMEPFTVHPLAGRFGIPVLGVMYAVALFFYILGVLITHPVHNVFLVFSVAVSLAVFALYAVQVYGNKNYFDFLFPKRTSYNVMCTVEAEKEAEYTLILGSHYDSDMDRSDAFLWLRDKNLPPWLASVLKVVVLGSLPTLLAMSFIAMFLPQKWLGARAFMFIFPAVFCGLSIFYMVTYFSYRRRDSKKGRAGLTASAITLAVADYLRQHPEKVSKNCRVVLVGFGSKECGAKGSEAFYKQHIEEDKDYPNPSVLVFTEAKPKGNKVFLGEKQLKLSYNLKLTNTAYNSMKNDDLNPEFCYNKVMFTDAAPFGFRKVPSAAVQLNAAHTGETLKFDEAFCAAADIVLNVLGELDEQNKKRAAAENEVDSL